MDYNFYSLNPRTFEQLIQSLARKLLGNGLLTFGDGPDGGKEATFEGKAPFPGPTECWDGKWVIQAKFKTRTAKEDSKKTGFNWVKKEFQQEMKKFANRKVKSGFPRNYLFFTNVVLTPAPGTGGRDQIEELARQYADHIPHIKIFGYDELCGFLDNNRDVATTYSSFILPGDILQKLYEFLLAAGTSTRNQSHLLGRFLEAEFREDLQSRLDHAGKLTTDKVHLEKVFVDLYATADGIIPKDEDQKRFLESCLLEGNNILRPGSEGARYVLTGGPGYGKSTLTQFLCQVYRAYFLKNLDTCAANPLTEIPGFIEDFQKIMPVAPTCFRFPVRVLLKDFAGWLAGQKAKNEHHTLLMYLKYRIERKGDGGTLGIDDIRQLLGKLSFVFIFDGLDEVPAASNREEVLKEIDHFIEIDLRRCDGDALIIATTRPQGYTNEFDRSRFTHLTLTDLPAGDCLTYLDRLLQAIDPEAGEREKHLEILKNALDHNVISSLMKTPLQVSIMAILVKSGGEPPRYKYDLFTEYYNIILKRERQKNICRVLTETPVYIDHIHNQLGYTLQLAAEQSENPAAHISRDEFKRLVSGYLVSLKLSEEEVEALTGQIVQAVMERLVFLDEVVEGRIGFNIRSLQEYFAANYYIKNQPDEIIRQRLNYMCKSAYWRNTFLFALGYIYNHKNYLVDTVESICRELNGSANQPGVTSGSAVCKLGSWLALEILVEGIFRGNPLYENKFAGLLEDLFTISPSYKHSRFGSLSVDIKDKWILPFIEKYTSRGVYEDQLAGWTVGIYLLKHNFEPVKAVWDKNWLSGPAEVKLVKHFIKLKVREDQWFIEKFLSALKRNPCFTFYEELSADEFLYNAALSPANDFETRRILIQNLFIYMIPELNLTDYLKKAIDHILGHGFIGDILIIKVSIKGKLGKQYWGDPVLFDGTDRIEIELFPGYKLDTYSVKSTHKSIKKLIEVFSTYKIDYLERLMLFLSAPDKHRLKEVFAALKDEPADSVVVIKSGFRSINWLLAKILHRDESLEKILQDIEDNRYGDVEDWLEFERRIVQKDMVYEHIDLLNNHIRRFVSGDSLNDFKFFFKNYYLRFKDDPHLKTKQRLYQNLLWFGLICIINKSIAFKKYLAENPLIIHEIFSCLEKVKLDDLEKWQFSLIFFNLLQGLTEQEIMKIEEQEGELVEKFKFHEGYLPIGYEELIPRIFSRVANVLSHALSDNRESGLIRVPVWALLNGRLTSLPSLELNFKDLQNASYENPDNEACRILICLLDPGLDQPKARQLAETAKQRHKTIPPLPGFIIQLIKQFGLKGDWVEPFLLEVYSLVDRHHHDVKTKFENYFKDLLESLPSHLHDKEVQNQLKLN